MSQEIHSEAALPDPEILIGRLVDGEASDGDRARFERLANGKSDLWKTLALRQLDMSMLSDRVVAATAPAERVEARAAAPRAWHASLAFSGWAAALVLGLWWLSAPAPAPSPRVEPASDPGPPVVAADGLSPAELLHRYVASTFVIGELDPIMTEHQDLGNGRHQIWYTRRIEESVVIDRPFNEVVGTSGTLLVDPSQLRKD